METIKDLKELIIHSCEKWLKDNPEPNAYLPLARESIEDLLIVLKSNI